MQSNSLMDKLKQVEQLSDKEQSFLQETEGTSRTRREIPPTLDDGLAEKVPAKGKGKSRAVSGDQPAVKPRRRPSAPKVAIDLDPAVVPWAQSTFSMPCVILDALRDASHARKKGRERPFTQQDIVSAAVIEWLTSEGHWPPTPDVEGSR